jgi:transcriptional regulator with XRE-family HTH domain
LKEVRRLSGLTWREVSDRSQISPGHLSALSSGNKRTRRSTLARLASVVVDANPDLGDVEALVDDLCQIAGPALAAESDYRDRVDRRWARKERRQTRQAKVAALRAWRASFGTDVSFWSAWCEVYPPTPRQEI